jgi:hypothetical protein
VSGVSRWDLHQHTAGFLTHLVGPQRLVSRGSEGFARAQAEVRTVTRTNDLAGFHLSFSERLAIVGATIFYCVYLQSATYDNHREAIDLNGQRFRLVNGLARTHIDPL